MDNHTKLTRNQLVERLMEWGGQWKEDIYARENLVSILDEYEPEPLSDEEAENLRVKGKITENKIWEAFEVMWDRYHPYCPSIPEMKEEILPLLDELRLIAHLTRKGR